MKPKSLLIIGLSLVALAGIVLFRLPDPAPPQVIYLLDARRDAGRPLDQALPVFGQLARLYDATVSARPASSITSFTDLHALLDAFDKTQSATPQEPLFFALEKPYSTTKKQLRAAIDADSSLHGRTRVELLKRVVVVLDPGNTGDPEECRQLGDDIVYATWTFSGTGLVVRDDTVQALKQCIDTLTPAA